MRIWKWPARWRCHRSIWCCQYVDTSLCNGSKDPHRVSRTRRNWKAARMERSYERQVRRAL